MLRSLFFLVLITAGIAAAQLTTQSSTTDGVTTVTFSMPAKAPNYAFSRVPYSARQSYSSVRTLPGGIHLTQKPIVTFIWQDSAGRKRTEQRIAVSGGTTVTVTQILDPVEGATYVLEPSASIAHRFQGFRQVDAYEPDATGTGHRTSFHNDKT